MASQMQPAARGASRRERVLFLAALAVIAAHVIDDSFVHPQPGTSAADHLVSGLVPVAVLAAVAWAWSRARGARRGAVALGLGVLGVAAGAEAVHYTAAVGASGDDFTGLLCLPAAVLLLGLGAATLWRTRRIDGGRARRYVRRVLIGAGAVLAGAIVVLPVSLAYVTTHVGRAAVPPNRLGVAAQDVAFTTRDGLRLRGWYVPSRNGAAVIVFPGRKGPQRQTRMLARHGYGVLLFDRRGEGQSEGDPNAWGWGGDEDVKSAIRFLRARPDVDPRRIGGLGLSVGGELMLETAAETRDLAAVVSEGAGARTLSEDREHDAGTADKVVSAPFAVVLNASIAVFADQAPPTNLRHLVGRIAPRPVLLIAAPHSPAGEDLNRGYRRAGGPTTTLWEIPESGHVGGLTARPREYERRVVGFFDRALLR